MWIIHKTLPENEEPKMKMEKENCNENGNALINIKIQKWKNGEKETKNTDQRKQER